MRCTKAQTAVEDVDGCKLHAPCPNFHDGKSNRSTDRVGEYSGRWHAYVILGVVGPSGTDSAMMIGSPLMKLQSFILRS